MDLIYLLRVLLKRKWIIICSALLAASIAYFMTRNQPKKFRSGARVSTGFTVSDEIKVNKESYSFYEADTKFNNAIVTFTSPSVTSLLSYMLMLHDLDSEKPFRKLTEEQIKSDLYKQVDKKEAAKILSNNLQNMTMLTSFKPEEKKLLEYINLYGYGYRSINSNLNVYRVERTDYIQIDYVSENPELSAFVVNNVFQQFLRYFGNVRSSNSKESIDTLRSLMEKKKQELDLKKAMLGGESMIGMDLQGGSKLDLIANLEQSLTSEKSRQIELYSSLKKVEQKLANTGGSVIKQGNNNNDELIALRKAKNEAYRDYLNSGSSDRDLLDKYNRLNDEYQKKFLESNSSIGRVDNDNDQDKIRKLLMNQKNDLLIDIEAIGTNITLIQAKINSLKGSVASDASRSVATETLLKDVDLAEKEYLAIKEKYNSATDISGSSVNNFRQVLLGQPAFEPEPSKRILLVGMAGFATLITTMLIIILLAYLDSSIKTPGIFSKAVNLKLISMVNMTNLQKKKIPEILSRKPLSDDPDNKREDNVFRESIRKLRYEIEKTGKKIFLFTSTKKGMGKTTLIQALSYSLSLSKKKILIIDTNFSNNDLTMQLEAEPLLEKMTYSTTNETTIIDQVKKIAKVIASESIYVIGSEGGDYTPAEILPTDNILKHLSTLTKEFDYIFLEGPPLNDFSDSKELAEYAEGVIAVFSATHSLKLIDKESINFYRDLDGKFCGAILNKIDLENINVS